MNDKTKRKSESETEKWERYDTVTVPVKDFPDWVDRMSRAAEDCLNSTQRHIKLAHRYLDGEFDGDGYSYFDCNTRSRWRVGLEDLEDLGRRLEEGESDAYSRWCSDTDAKELR